MFANAALRQRIRSCDKRLLDVRRRRFLRFEQLEDRLLLDGGLANVALSAAQRQALVNGLQSVTTWFDTLSSFNKIAQPISIVDKSIGQELGLGSILQNQLTNRLASTSATTTNDVVNTLKGLSATAAGLTVTVNPVSLKIMSSSFELVRHLFSSSITISTWLGSAFVR